MVPCPKDITHQAKCRTQNFKTKYPIATNQQNLTKKRTKFVESCHQFHPRPCSQCLHQNQVLATSKTRSLVFTKQVPPVFQNKVPTALAEVQWVCVPHVALPSCPERCDPKSAIFWMCVSTTYPPFLSLQKPSKFIEHFCKSCKVSVSNITAFSGSTCWPSATLLLLRFPSFWPQNQHPRNDNPEMSQKDSVGPLSSKPLLTGSPASPGTKNVFQMPNQDVKCHSCLFGWFFHFENNSATKSIATRVHAWCFQNLCAGVVFCSFCGNKSTGIMHDRCIVCLPIVTFNVAGWFSLLGDVWTTSKNDSSLCIIDSTSQIWVVKK